MTRTDRPKPRGAALPVAIILLGALTIIGVAAVSLSAAERRNAAAFYHVDFVQECANAAQAQIWGYLAQNGLAALNQNMTITYLQFPDGTRVAPGHVDSVQPDGTVIRTNLVELSTPAANKTRAQEDCTNRACGLAPPDSTYTMSATCIDSKGRRVEVEAGIRISL